MTLTASHAADSNPVLAYWEEIQSGKVTVGKKIKTLYSRLAADIQNPRTPWVYDEKRANHVIVFVEKYCKHTKGKWGGKPVL